jgi:hypothetical protein
MWVCWLWPAARWRREKKGWQRPTLPHRCQCSTIGARELNCRVRDGAGWTLTALATNNTSLPCLARFTHTYIPPRAFPSRTTPARSRSLPRVFHKGWLFTNLSHIASLHSASPATSTALSRLDLGKRSTFSTGQLHMLPCVHLRPIQLVVCQRSYLVSQSGVSSWGRFPT